MENAEIEKKVKDLMVRHAAVQHKKALLQGQLQSKKKELEALVVEIKAEGLDPKNLAEETKKARESLEAEILAFESDLTKVEAALATYDNK